MLLLVTILLVVVGTISLVIGFVQSSLLPIYISIACSVLAAVVLLIFSRMTSKSQQVATADGGPAPLDVGRDTARTGEREPAFVGTGLLAGSSDGESFAPDAGYGTETSHHGIGDDDELAPLPDDDFPIERYDQRRVGEILPLLAELDLDELDIVREHEEQGKSRATVLARIDQLIDQLEAEDRAEAASRFDQDDTAAVSAVPDLDDADDADRAAVDDEERAPLDLEPIAPPPPPTQAVSVAALPDDDGYFPIEDYEDLRASEILPLLPELDDDELVMVQQRESAGPARSSILRRIDALLVTSSSDPAGPPPALEPEPQPEPEPAPDLELSPVAAVEVPGDDLAKKTPSKRAPAARKTPAKKAPVVKVTAAKAPAAKVPAAKFPAAKAPAAKGSVSKVSAPRKSAAPSTKAPVRKSSKAAGILEKSGTINVAPKKAGRTAAAPVVTKKAASRTTTVKAPAAKKAPVEKVAKARAAAATKGGGTASAAKAAKATRKATKG